MKSEIEFITSQTCQNLFLKIFYKIRFLSAEIPEKWIPKGSTTTCPTWSLLLGVCLESGILNLFSEELVFHKRL